MTGNWFKVHRSLTKSELWLSEPFTRGQAWLDLLALAAFKPGYVRVGSIRVDILRGQLATAERFLCERWQWSRGKVRRFLEELERDGRVVQTKSTVSTVLTIANYDAYQGDGTDDATDGETNDGPATVQTAVQTAGQTTDQSKERKESKKARREKKGVTPLSPVVELPPSIAMDSLKAAVDEWLAYKAERRESYKPTGLRAFLSEVAEVVAAEGEAATIAKMRRAMSSGWRGWNFDRPSRISQRSADDPRGTMAAMEAYLNS